MFTAPCKISGTILTWEMAHATGCHQSAAARLLLASQDRLLLAVMECLFRETDGALQEPTAGIIANASGVRYTDRLYLRCVCFKAKKNTEKPHIY